MLWGAALAPTVEAAIFRKNRRRAGKKTVTQQELRQEITPGRLIYNNSARVRRLAFQSVIKQTMDRNYSQRMLEEVAQLFWAKKYRPVVMVLDPNERPEIVDLSDLDGSMRGNGSDYSSTRPDLGMQGGELGNAGNDGAGTRGPDTSGDKTAMEGMARDLENGIHNEILRVMKEKGYNLVALNVFAQTMDLVKVIMIVATRDLAESRIRPTLREIRSIIENEVLAAKYPGVHLAELSSFTLLNEKDNHFYEHPVLYWQLKDPKWSGTGGGPMLPGTLQGEGPVVGGVASGPSKDFFRSEEFEPEEDFDELELLKAPGGEF